MDGTSLPARALRRLLARLFPPPRPAARPPAPPPPRPSGYSLDRRFDGSTRVHHHTPPFEALERGPVWVVDTLRGDLDYVAAHASFATADDRELLVLYGEDELLGAIPGNDLFGYDVVTVVDPEAEIIPGRRLWKGLQAGDELTLVYVDTGVRD